MPTSAQSPKFSILILSYRRSDLLSRQLSEIVALCRGDFEVVVGDNGSPNREVSLVASSYMLNTPLRIRTGRTSPNIGFGRAFNNLMALADGEYLICLSDDVRIFGDIIAPLDEQFAAEPDTLICHRLIDWPAGWNQFGDKVFNYPEGYLLAASRATWEKLGHFDPRYYPSDYEDVDVGYTAASIGVTLTGLSALPVQHIGAQTVGHSPERMQQTVAMRALFAEKWGLPNIPERP